MPKFPPRRSLYAIQWLAIALVAAAWPGGRSFGKGPAEYVIQISVDGGGSSYVQRLIDDGALPHFKRLQTEGAGTNNARTDYDFTITLPNHTCMLTGRPVYDKPGDKGPNPGHLWTSNGEPGDATLHSNAHTYVKTTFDVAHDNGLATGLFASKTKFVLYCQSYDAAHGAPDVLGKDNGRAKIDQCTIDPNSAEMTRKLVQLLREKPANYSFVHFAAADVAGHAKGWGSSEYDAALKEVDADLGAIFEAIAANPKLAGHTAIILTADHGGFGYNHSDKADPRDFTIPFYVWGAGAARGADLYQLNRLTRRDPGARQIDYTADGLQPIRNGDAGNLALRLLGLTPIPDSSINVKQDLATDAAEARHEEK